MVLESKQDMRRRGVPSPDEGDAVALCFSEPVIAVAPRRPRSTRRIASWMAA
jgi:hypothetical protein